MDKPTYLTQASLQNPYHMSVGLAVIARDAQVLYLKQYVHSLRSFAYLLPTTTPYANETLSDSLQRIVNEKLPVDVGVSSAEFTYIGSGVYRDEWFGELSSPTGVEKTELYFKAGSDFAGREKGVMWSKPHSTDEEVEALGWRDIVEVGFMELADLMEKMRSPKHPLSYLDQSAVLEKLFE